MRDLTPDLAQRLAAPVTRLCRLWRLTRRDGLVLAFTDHDRDLVVGGVTHAAASGLDPSETTAELGFAVGGGEVAGVLAAASLTEADLAAGLWDGASVETWMADWSAPDARVLLDIATIGEVRRGETGFVAETRSLMHALDAEQGRLYTPACDADFGDARCGIDLNAPAYRAQGTVLSTDGHLRIRCPGLTAFADGWFTRGRLLWTSGANQGSGVEIKAHRGEGGESVLDLWQATAAMIMPGDAFTLTAGCDKQFATCRDRFANAVNFRGFPHMPGNDYLVRVARQGEPGLDGGSLFR
jgi:uncharacterized phage protein (TIGR02218 family)